MRAVAYARYSTANQQETSIAAQIEGIRAFCDRQGLELSPMLYIDEARSGMNTDRPGFQRLVADARDRKFDAVVVYDVSRGSRNIADWFYFRQEMQALNVKVFSATNQLGDVDDPNAFLIEMISVGMGQHMVLQSRQKSIAGKRIRAGRGLFCGGNAPLGYNIVDGHYVVNEAEARAVEHIFTRYAAGATYGQILEDLERMGVRSKYGNRIERPGLNNILNNERYTGKFVWFDREERHMHRHVGRDNPDKIIVEDAIPPIIDQELFDQVQERLHSNRARIRPAYHDYLLSGKIRCGECGSAMSGITTRSKGHEYSRYICLGKRIEKRCTLKNVNAAELEESVLQGIRDQLLNEDVIATAVDHLFEKLSLKDAPADVKSLQSQLMHVRKKDHNIAEAIAEVGITPEFKAQLKANEARRHELQEQIDRALPASALTRERIEAILRDDTARLVDNPEAIRDLARQYVESVLVYHDRIEIRYSVKGPKIEEQSDEADCTTDKLPRYARFELFTLVLPRLTA